MCVIAIKPREVEMPREEKLKAMWDKNKDGAGFMYSLNGDVMIEKGFMVYQDFKLALENLQGRLTAFGLTTKDIPIVLHYRITTHGGTSPSNTHPFPVSDNVEHLKALDVKCKLGLAHNGIITTVEKETDISDTMVFIRDIMAPLSQLSLDFSDKLLPTLKATIGWSRLAFLYGDGKIDMIGDFKSSTDSDGLFYSNLNHETPVYVPQVVTPRKSYYDDGYLDDYAYGYGGYSRKRKNVSKTLKDFIVGKKYVIADEFKNLKHHEADKDKIFIYLGNEAIHHSYMGQSMGRFEELGGKRDVPYWKYFTIMTPYVEKVEETVVVDEKKDIIPNAPHNIGGRFNDETRKIKQNANRILYRPEKLDKISLAKVSKGKVITDFNNLERQLTHNALDLGKYIMIVTSDNLYYWRERYCYVYKQKDGNFMQINPADLHYEYIEEDGILVDFKYSHYHYSRVAHKEVQIFKNVIVYTRVNWEQTK